MYITTRKGSDFMCGRKDYYTDEDYDYLEKLCPKIEDIINKYEVISGFICVKCGAPATHFKDGLPYCEEDN